MLLLLLLLLLLLIALLGYLSRTIMLMFLLLMLPLLGRRWLRPGLQAHDANLNAMNCSVDAKIGSCATR